MTYKVVFVMMVYLITFIGCIVYGVINWRAYEIQNDDTTMMDFAALVTGLPRLPGDRMWEDELKAFFSEKTGEPVVGVSICWDFGSQVDEIQEILEDELSSRESYPPIEPSGVEDSRSSVQKSVFGGVDNAVGAVLGLDTPGGEKPPTDEGEI